MKIACALLQPYTGSDSAWYTNRTFFNASQIAEDESRNSERDANYTCPSEIFMFIPGRLLHKFCTPVHADDACRRGDGFRFFVGPPNAVTANGGAKTI